MQGGAAASDFPGVHSDFGALTERATRTELLAFKRGLPSTSVLGLNRRAIAGSIIRLIGLLAGWFIATATFVAGLEMIAPYQTSRGFIVNIGELVIVGALVFVTWYFFTVARRRVRLFRPLRKWLALIRYSRANGWAYHPGIAEPRYPGSVFLAGKDRMAVDIMRRRGEGRVDVGNYEYTATAPHEYGRRRWGYIRISLDRQLPHMVLESTAHRKPFRRGLPVTFRRDQTLSLEGNFNKFFTLYAPTQYERDALYVFAPDLMALLIDNAADFDVEIVDNQLFVYSNKPFDMLSPATYALVQRLVATIGAKALRQTAHYADDRAGESAGSQVAPEGRRLRVGVGVATVITVVLWIAVQLLPAVLRVTTGN
jgi:hypothetical protein